MKKLVFTAFAVGLSLTANFWAQVPSYVPTNGLVGWWPFNGNANDESGNGNNGTVNGATLTTDRNGVANKAYSFDGVNDFIQCIQSGFSGNQSMSVSFWIKSGNGSGHVFSFGSNGTSGNDFRILINSYGSCGNSVAFDIYNSGTAFTTTFNNSWDNYIVTFNSSLGNSVSSCSIYKNGIILSNNCFNVSNVLPNFLNNFPITFGRYHGTIPSDFLLGQLDDIAFWTRVLTNQEITALYNGCGNEISSQPSSANSIIGSNPQFNVGASSGSTYQWQSNPLNLGWQNINNNSNYSGATSNTVTVSNASVSNHNQPFRAIVNAGGCIDTSNIATIQIADTCINNVTVYDTLITTVTDTLIINTTLSLPAPNNENTILIYPNPASDHITIDNGNYAAMAGYTIKIENNAGQQVFQSLINQAQFYVDLSTWSGNGLYFVHLIDPQNNTVTVRKIVSQ